MENVWLQMSVCMRNALNTSREATNQVTRNIDGDPRTKYTISCQMVTFYSQKYEKKNISE